MAGTGILGFTLRSTKEDIAIRPPRRSKQITIRRSTKERKKMCKNTEDEVHNKYRRFL